MVRWVPGFRTGKRWKQILAVVGYLLVVLFWLIGLAQGIIATWALLAAWYAVDAFGVRTAATGRMRSRWAPAIIVGPGGFVVAALAAAPFIPAPAPRPTPTPTPVVAAAQPTAVPPTVAATVPALPTSAPTVAPTATVPAPTSTSVPPTAVPPTAAPQPTNPPAPTAVAFRSGGLGLDREEWERTAGRPNGEQAGFVNYQNGSRAVLFIGGRVEHIERTWGDRNAVALDAAKSEGKALLPEDARLVRSYTSRSGRQVDLYHSDSLADRFEETWFTGGEPGDCVVIYRQGASGRVTSIVVSTGNNP